MLNVSLVSSKLPFMHFTCFSKKLHYRSQSNEIATTYYLVAIKVDIGWQMAIYGLQLAIIIELLLRMMNFHNNTALTKVLHTLQDSQNSSKQSKQIYQSVLLKHFQIIQNFLEKINLLYNKHQQFENSLAAINEKIQKLQTNSKNIHYQFRSTHLMIDKRLNTIGADFNNIQEQLKNIQLESPIDNYLTSSQFLAQSSRLKARKRKSKRRDLSKNEGYKVVVYSHNEIDLNESMKQQEEKQGKSKRLFLKLKGSCKTINRGELKTVQFDGVSSQSSQNFDDSELNMNGVRKKESFPLQMDSQQSEDEGIDEEWVKQQIKKQTTQLTEEFNAKLKQLQNLLIKNREQIESQMAKKQQFELLQYQLLQKISDKTDEVRKNIQNEQMLIREEVITLAKQNNVTLQQFETRLVQKLDNAYFQESLTNLNAALSEQFTKIQRFYANKLQTKKAFEFLENKLNRFILEQNAIKSKKVVVNNQDLCLKINKCQSHKKIDLMSEKSIKDRVQKLQQGGQPLYKSLDTSMWQIQAAENSNANLTQQKNNLNSLLTNISKLKSPTTSGLSIGFKQKDLSKAGKSLSAPKKQARLSLTITNAQPKVNIKQWREKVVKILRKEDIRKRKVTFR